MNATSGTLAHAQSPLQNADKHVVVRSGDSWFSIPASAVSEITWMPDLVSVPQCHPSLIGLCQVRSEFIPVLDLSALLGIDSRESEAPSKLLVVRGRNAWACSIHQADAIASLETVITPDSKWASHEPSPIAGTAMYRDQIVRVLDPLAVFRAAQAVLQSHWHHLQGTDSVQPSA